MELLSITQGRRKLLNFAIAKGGVYRSELQKLVIRLRSRSVQLMAAVVFVVGVFSSTRSVPLEFFRRRCFLDLSQLGLIDALALGGPGAGKGTQCQRLVNDFGYMHLSAGTPSSCLRAYQHR